MKRKYGFAVMALLLLAAAAPCLWAQPTKVKACAVLRARAESAAVNSPDTMRIQKALRLCMPDEAVVMKKQGDNDAFLSARIRPHTAV